MIINHNLSSMNAQRMMGINSSNASKAMQKLSSGLRINSAADDAAGLAISEKMRGQIRGLDQASSNAQDAISMIQTGEGALNETHSILQRMRELAVQSATDTNTADDRGKIQSEVDQLAKEITRISNTTEFNTQNLLAGGLDDTFQVGANKGQNINLTIKGMDAQSLGVAGASVTTTFTNTNTSVATLSTTSPNLNGQYVCATKTGTSAGAITKSNAGGGAGTADVSTFTGSADATFQVKITGNTAGKVTSASYTTDGGTTWTNASVDSTGADGIVTLQNGAKLTITTNVANANNDTYTFDAHAEYLSFQLNSAADGSGTAIGSVVKSYNNQTSVTLGDDASNSTATITYNFNTVKGAIAVAGTYEGDQITQTVKDSQAAVIGANGSVQTDATVEKGIDVSSQGAANSAIETINNAITTVSEERSKLGAYQNRLEHTIANLNTSSENLTSSESRVRDVDMAKEMSEYSKNNILSQAAQAMLAQANQQPQQVLQLLR